MALAGCMAIDLADIVTKGRHPLTALEARITGERAPEPPRRFTHFTLHFVVTGDVPTHAIERAIQLSRDKVLLGVALAPAKTSRWTPRSRLPLRRKAYLDWLRGVAVIVMVGAHVTDAWTRIEDRERDLYGYTVIVAGLASPLFLFLAGLTLSLAASTRAAAVGHAAAAVMASRRALQIFALAFLFRLQSQLLGWGPLVNFLKVDILNVMGVTMLAAALLWSLSSNRVTRIALFALATAAVANDHAAGA